MWFQTGRKWTWRDHWTYDSTYQSVKLETNNLGHLKNILISWKFTSFLYVEGNFIWSNDGFGGIRMESYSPNHFTIVAGLKSKLPFVADQYTQFLKVWFQNNDAQLSNEKLWIKWHFSFHLSDCQHSAPSIIIQRFFWIWLRHRTFEDPDTVYFFCSPCMYWRTSRWNLRSKKWLSCEWPFNNNWISNGIWKFQKCFTCWQRNFWTPSPRILYFKATMGFGQIKLCSLPYQIKCTMWNFNKINGWFGRYKISYWFKRNQQWFRVLEKTSKFHNVGANERISTN